MASSDTKFIPNDPRLIGNQYAIGNKGGRPRTVSLQPDEMIELGHEMIQWLKEHPKALHLSAWYSIEKGFTDKMWATMQTMPEFLPYYEQALKIVGQKYLDKDSNVRDGISQRWQRVYFKDLRISEDADADAEAERKAKAHKAESQASAAYIKEITDSVQRERKPIE